MPVQTRSSIVSVKELEAAAALVQMRNAKVSVKAWSPAKAAAPAAPAQKVKWNATASTASAATKPGRRPRRSTANYKPGAFADMDVSDNE